MPPQIEFRIRALGTPKPSIQWYKDDLEIFSCDRIEMREEEDGGAVVLKGARYSEARLLKAPLFGLARSTCDEVEECDQPRGDYLGFSVNHFQLISFRFAPFVEPFQCFYEPLPPPIVV